MTTCLMTAPVTACLRVELLHRAGFLLFLSSWCQEKMIIFTQYPVIIAQSCWRLAWGFWLPKSCPGNSIWSHWLGSFVLQKQWCTDEHLLYESRSHITFLMASCLQLFSSFIEQTLSASYLLSVFARSNFFSRRLLVISSLRM